MLRWWYGWTPLFLLPAAVILLTPSTWPRWGFMWALALAIYCGCKWLTWRRGLEPVRNRPHVWKQAGYLLAWPGMDAPTFFNLHRHAAVPAPSRSEWFIALARLTLGLVLLFVVARQAAAWRAHPYVVGWIGMVGLVLILHFGLFHLLSCGWRTRGVAAVPLMDRPLTSVSVSEFWGKRWNLAFRDLTHRFLFRPLTRRLGPRWALGVGFLCSGLVHDLVISLPAGGGYGGPTLFFILQGSAIFVERGPLGRLLGLGAGWRGWLFTMGVLLGPVYLLFPPAFVEGVMGRFMQALGAI